MVTTAPATSSPAGTRTRNTSPTAAAVRAGEKSYALAYASGADGYYLRVEGDGSVYTVDGTAAAAFVPAEELKS